MDSPGISCDPIVSMTPSLGEFWAWSRFLRPFSSNPLLFSNILVWRCRRRSCHDLVKDEPVIVALNIIDNISVSAGNVGLDVFEKNLLVFAKSVHRTRRDESVVAFSFMFAAFSQDFPTSILVVLAHLREILDDPLKKKVSDLVVPVQIPLARWA